MFTMLTAWSRARKYRVAGETELSHLFTVWKGRLRFQKLGSGMPQDLNPGKPRCTEPPDWPSGAPCWQPGEQHPGSSGLNYESPQLWLGSSAGASTAGWRAGGEIPFLKSSWWLKVQASVFEP